MQLVAERGSWCIQTVTDLFIESEATFDDKIFFTLQGTEKKMRTFLTQFFKKTVFWTLWERERVG